MNRLVLGVLATIAGVALVFSVISGCGQRVVLVRGGPIPDWVDRMPNRAGTVCALGFSGPTFYQQDCAGNAAKNARGHLADTISATIKTVTVDISDGTRGQFTRDVFVEGSETVSEAVLQGSEIHAQWLDIQGQRGAPNGCYVMVCIDPSKPIDSFVEQIEKKLPKKTVEQVRENAAAAFADLEAQEAREAAKKALNPPAPEVAPPEEQAPAPVPGASPDEEEAAPASGDTPPPEQPADSPSPAEASPSGDPEGAVQQE